MDTTSPLSSPMMVVDGSDKEEDELVAQVQPRLDAAVAVSQEDTDGMNENNNSHQQVFVSLEPPPFTVDQRVFCRDKATKDAPLYQAIIRQTKHDTNEWRFLVHYLGWNARWDRWTNASSLLDADSETAKQLYRQQQEKKTSAPSTPFSPSSRKRKVKGESTISSPSSSRRKVAKSHQGATATTSSTITAASRAKIRANMQEYCELPLTLKTILVQELEVITRRGWDSPHGYDNVDAAAAGTGGFPPRVVYALPAKVPIRKALNYFAKSKANEVSHQKPPAAGEPPLTPQDVEGFVHGLVRLFQEALPTCLLYSQERPQYERIAKELSEQEQSKELVDIYGCEFLLRLFVRLPVLMQPVDYVKRPYIGPLVADLIVLLQKNRQACFKGQYRSPKLSERLDWERTLYSSTDNKRSLPAKKLAVRDTSSSQGGPERMGTQSP